MNFMVYDGWSFSYPELLFAAKPQQLPGLFAIQVINPSWKPLPYEPIYFGESDDLGSVSLMYHPAFERWSAHPGIVDGGLLYVSYLWLTRGAEFREHVERALIARYRPPCNFLSGMATRRPLVRAGANSLAQRSPG